LFTVSSSCFVKLRIPDGGYRMFAEWSLVRVLVSLRATYPLMVSEAGDVF